MFEPGRLLGHFPENVDGAQNSPNILHLSPGLIMMVIRMSMVMPSLMAMIHVDGNGTTSQETS